MHLLMVQGLINIFRMCAGQCANWINVCQCEPSRILYALEDYKEMDMLQQGNWWYTPAPMHPQRSICYVDNAQIGTDWRGSV